MQETAKICTQCQMNVYGTMAPGSADLEVAKQSFATNIETVSVVCGI